MAQRKRPKTRSEHPWKRGSRRDQVNREAREQARLAGSRPKSPKTPKRKSAIARDRDVEKRRTRVQTVAAELIRTGDKRAAAKAAGVGVRQVDAMLGDPVVGKVVRDAVEAALAEAGSTPVEVVLAMRRMALADPLLLVNDQGTGMRDLSDIDDEDLATRAAISDVEFTSGTGKDGNSVDLMVVRTVDAKTRAGAQQTLAKMHKLLIDRKESSEKPLRPYDNKPETKAEVIRGLMSLVRPKKDPK